MLCLFCKKGKLVSVRNNGKRWKIFCNYCGHFTINKKDFSVRCPLCNELAVRDNWKAPGDPSDYGTYIQCFYCLYDSRNFDYCPGCNKKTLKKITSLFSTQYEEYCECLACGFITEGDYEDLPY